MNETIRQYDKEIDKARKLMIAKNADYGDSWRDMRLSSITDQILVKVKRIIQLEELAAKGMEPAVSEGIESEYRDILNYAAFGLIKITEGKEVQGEL